MEVNEPSRAEAPEAPFYKIDARGDGVYRISEPLGVGENVILGSERALLIDTGYGLKDIRPAVRQITDLPLFVMNSHVHTDHTGCNSAFETVYVPGGELPKIFDGSLDRERLQLFQSLHQSRPNLRQFMVQKEEWETPPQGTQYLPLPEKIDLGGRVLELELIGGHTPESTMVIDPQSRTAFVADGIGTQVWLFLHPTGTVQEYSESLRRFSRRTDVDILQLSHKTEPMPFSFAAYYADFVLRARIENSVVWPNNRFDVTVYRYTEPESPYGAVSMFYCETNLG